MSNNSLVSRFFIILAFCAFALIIPHGNCPAADSLLTPDDENAGIQPAAPENHAARKSEKKAVPAAQAAVKKEAVKEPVIEKIIESAPEKKTDEISIPVAPQQVYEKKEKAADGQAKSYTMTRGKVAILSYKMSKPAKINKITISASEKIPLEKRAKKIEVLTSELGTNEEADWLSSGVFNLSATDEVMVCGFEPVVAQYIKLKILESYGPEISPTPGKVSIGIATFKITGNIVDAADKAPLASAEIYLSGAKAATSDAAGAFTINDCDYGTHEIIARATGYLEARQTLPIFSGKKVSIVFKLKRHSYVISGKVRDVGTSKPIALCEIKAEKIESDGRRTPVKSLLSDELGFYHVESMSAGKYELKVSTEGYNELLQQVDIDPKKSYEINFLMKSKIDSRPFGVTGFLPRADEAMTDEIRVVFSHPVHVKSFNVDNFVFEYREQNIDEAISKKQPIDVLNVAADPADSSGRTLLLKITTDEKLKKMPGLDLNIFNVSDESGRKLSEEGILISNYAE